MNNHSTVNNRITDVTQRKQGQLGEREDFTEMLTGCLQDAGGPFQG